MICTLLFRLSCADEGPSVPRRWHRIIRLIVFFYQAPRFCCLLVPSFRFHGTSLLFWAFFCHPPTPDVGASRQLVAAIETAPPSSRRGVAILDTNVRTSSPMTSLSFSLAPLLFLSRLSPSLFSSMPPSHGAVLHHGGSRLKKNRLRPSKERRKGNAQKSVKSGTLPSNSIKLGETR